MESFQTLLVLMVVVWGFGKIFRALSLPIIFGELIGGIVVGPLVLGLVDPGSEIVKILAELGIFFLMLHSGLETDPKQLFKASKKSLLISLFGILLPLAGGYFVAQGFGLTFEESIFVAVALSATAIAISVRLFKEFGIQRTNVANVTIGAAVIDNIIALILFSIVLGIVKTGQAELIPILWMLAKVILFFGIVIWGGMKLSKYANKVLKNKGFTFALIVALALGLIAEAIGLHIIIGAFLAGLFIRQEILDAKTFNKIEDRIYGLSYSFLGPIFFASLAFYLDFTAFRTAPWFLLAIILVAIFGKVIGAGGAALIQKIKPQKAVLIGLAMNSRGAVELIIASIGVKEGIISTEVFSILVIMAFTTTMFSIFTMGPLVKRAYPDLGGGKRNG